MMQSRTKKCFVVTGGAGFIGSHLCERLLAEGYRVIAIDDFNDFYNPTFKSNNQNFRTCELDICDLASLEGVFEREKADVIVHLAARAGVRASIENPLLYQKVNCLGTANLLQMAREYAVG